MYGGRLASKWLHINWLGRGLTVIVMTTNLGSWVEVYKQS